LLGHPLTIAAAAAGSLVAVVGKEEADEVRRNPTVVHLQMRDRLQAVGDRSSLSGVLSPFLGALPRQLKRRVLGHADDVRQMT